MDEPLLRPVVQVPDDAAALVGGGHPDPRVRRSELAARLDVRDRGSSWGRAAGTTTRQLPLTLAAITLSGAHYRLLIS